MGRVHGLFNPKNAADPFQEVSAKVAAYLERRSGGEIDSCYCESNRDGLFIRVKGAQDSRYLLNDLDGHGCEDTGLQLAVPCLYTFEQLKNLQLSRPVPVVEDFVYEGETALVAGKQKGGKTRMMQQMALGIVTGTEFLGMKIPRRRRVLIVDLENRLWAIRDRLLRMAGAETVAPGLSIWCSPSLSNTTIEASPDGIRELKKLIKQTEAEVVIIDPWRLFLGRDENDAGEVVRGLKALASLRENSPNLTIFIVHHVRKERSESPRSLLSDPRSWVDAVSGHHALTSHVDACYGLERHTRDDGEERIVFGGIARNTEPRTMLLDDDEDTLRFSVQRQQEALEQILTRAEKEVWVTAARLKGFTFKMLLMETNTTNRKAVSKTLKKARAQGFIKHSDKWYEVLGGE